MLLLFTIGYCPGPLFLQLQSFMSERLDRLQHVSPPEPEFISRVTLLFKAFPIGLLLLPLPDVQITMWVVFSGRVICILLFEVWLNSIDAEVRLFVHVANRGEDILLSCDTNGDWTVLKICQYNENQRNIFKNGCAVLIFYKQ